MNKQEFITEINNAISKGHFFSAVKTVWDFIREYDCDFGLRRSKELVDKARYSNPHNKPPGDFIWINLPKKVTSKFDGSKVSRRNKTFYCHTKDGSLIIVVNKSKKEAIIYISKNINLDEVIEEGQLTEVKPGTGILSLK